MLKTVTSVSVQQGMRPTCYDLQQYRSSIHITVPGHQLPVGSA